MMHRIEMSYTAQNPHIGETKVTVVIDRDGGLRHAIDTFRAFRLAVEFAAETIDRAVLEA